MHQNTSLNPIRQTVIYTFMSLGLFLFVFIGAKAIAGADDRKYVDGQRQQSVNGLRMPTPGTAEWLQARSASQLNYKPTASVTSGTTEQDSPKSNQTSKPELPKTSQEPVRGEKNVEVPVTVPAVKDKLDKLGN